MKVNEKTFARLRKLLALAEKGEGGEKANAQRMLDKLLEKYELSLSDIADDDRKEHWIKYSRTANGRKLLLQVIYSVCGDRDQWSSRHMKQCIGVECSEYEHIQINLKYHAYQAALKEQLDIAYNAFIQKNRIFPEPTSEAEDEDSSKEIDWDYWVKVAKMANGMDAVVVHEQLSHTQHEASLNFPAR